MGIAHNKNYFEWFEIARTEFCRRKGLPYAEIEARDYFFVVSLPQDLVDRLFAHPLP